MTTAITRSKTADLTFGGYEDIESIAKRIKMLMRGGEKLSSPEAMALAQFSTVTRLNPFIGECWYISGSGPMVGIAGARRLDQENTANRGGYSSVEIIPVPPAEAGAAETEIKDVVAAFRAEITDSAASLEYQKMFTATLKELREAGVPDPVGVAREICGPRPKWTGYGYSTKAERSRMNKVQLARKRAEADALKKRIVIPFGAELAETDVAPEYVEAVEVVQETRTEAQNMKELGFTDESHHDIGAGDVDKEYPPVSEKSADLKKQHAALWKQASAKGLVNKDTVTAWSIKANDNDEAIEGKIALLTSALEA
jgi:hypothetical protein